MGRGTTRRKRPKESSRPSLFFIIALAIGVAIFIWIATQVVRRPVPPPPKHSAVTQQIRRS